LCNYSVKAIQERVRP